jgi:hypothetical protein
MADLHFESVTRTQGNNRALKDGSVKPRSFSFDFVEVDPLIDAKFDAATLEKGKSRCKAALQQLKQK